MTTPDAPRPDDHSPEDIDAEFARMMEGLDLEDVPEATAPGSAAPRGEVGRRDDAPDPFDELQEQTEPTLAVVATAVASARALAGAVRLGQEARTDGLVVPPGTRIHETGTGAIAVGALDETGAHELAAVVSTALQRNGVVLFWRRGDRMTATRYRDGSRGDDVSPALVLGAVDGLVEQLLLGAQDLDDLGEGHDPSRLSRAEALEWLSDDGRGRRR
ncbi:hypothetical protein JSY14_03485 [Brachybacterium sp. EF45031]|uniref:hypothetical protein n=1 Tax=Brachybacterium sillae TaxID=2810536 RepID=UPI00217DF3F9|nr:hypothetical protein [Brachybacterium sillae]MCS6711120.1 hypothetical protein [Brachybacterium sillae]